MLAYATIGTMDLERAGLFYDALLAPLGAKRVRSFDRGIFYGEQAMELGVLLPADGGDPAPGNGTMVALQAPSREVVDSVHALALELGGSDEGGPGIRGRAESGWYGAYFRDPEGNKFAVFRIDPA